jgi:hypothetical protein
MLACCWAGTACAQLQLLPDKESQRVFAGEARAVRAQFRNADDNMFEADLRTRLLQVSSATAIPLGETAWKKLRVLPGQTVVESAMLNFPRVKAETRFLVQWFESTNRIIGKTEVLVYPTNLLNDLKPLAGEKPVGVLDPQNQLKPLLKKLDLEFADLEDTGLASFTGKLAIVGPFKSRELTPDDLAERIATFARKGGAVVWIQPPPSERERKLAATFYTVPLGDGAVVVAQAKLISGLADDPSAQLNLIHLTEYAVRHEPPRLPEPTR